MNYGVSWLSAFSLPSNSYRCFKTANVGWLLLSTILPLCQYYAYLEVGHAKDDGGGDATSLWRAYELVAGSEETMAMRKVSHRRDIYPVFRELFAKGGAKAEAS